MKTNDHEIKSLQFTEFLSQLTGHKVQAWVKQEKIDYMNRQQRYLKAILLITHLLSKPIPAEHTLFDSLISYYGYSKKKVEEFLMIVYYYKPKDYEAEFILKLLIESPFPKKQGSLYVKTRAAIMNTYKAKNSKEYLSSITYGEDEWFNVVYNIFISQEPKKLTQWFTEGIKELCKKEPKKINCHLTGSDILLININYLIQLYQNPDSRRVTVRSRTPTKQALTPVKERTKTPILSKQPPPIPKSTSKTNLKPTTAEVINQRHTEQINRISQELEGLRGALGRQRGRIEQLTTRQKYFISFIGKLKGKFLDLTASLHNKPLVFDEYQLLDPLLNDFKEYEQNIFKRGGSDVKDIQQKQKELKLIKEIEREQNSNKFIPYKFK